ncbi:hypothetical protein HZH68_009767 [Vespula germanica]|uniref:Uncharacterized protein n=1 Tax=Vespula germanica TaxID=30212 RepID=A0A834N494_VESGE|nr:hypothetical protein HZH68_009767 [Vespula germanica]
MDTQVGEYLPGGQREDRVGKRLWIIYVANWPVLRNKKQIRSFLRCYYLTLLSAIREGLLDNSKTIILSNGKYDGISVEYAMLKEASQYEVTYYSSCCSLDICKIRDDWIVSSGNVSWKGSKNTVRSFWGCSSDWKEKEVPYVYMWVEL